MYLEEDDLSIYFHYWYGKIPQWKVSCLAVPNLDNMDFFLYKIWLQAFSRIQSNIINRLRKGEIFKFDIKYNITQNIPAKWKRCFISLCPLCKKAVNIHLSRPIKYCPICARIKDSNEQRLRRAIKQGRKLCKSCGEILDKKYPNRDYCPGGACKQKAYRERKEHKKIINEIKELKEKNVVIG